MHNISSNTYNKRRRTKWNIIAAVCIISVVWGVAIPLSLIGYTINNIYGSTIGILIGIPIYLILMIKISRNLIAIERKGLCWQNIVWSGRHTIIMDWKTFKLLADANSINYLEINDKVEAWLDTNISHWHNVAGKLYFQKEEDLIHFKLVWF